MEWNGGVDYWSGVLDWTTGVPRPQYWQDRSWLQLNSIIVCPIWSQNQLQNWHRARLSQAQYFFRYHILQCLLYYAPVNNTSHYPHPVLYSGIDGELTGVSTRGQVKLTWAIGILQFYYIKSPISQIGVLTSGNAPGEGFLIMALCQIPTISPSNQKHRAEFTATDIAKYNIYMQLATKRGEHPHLSWPIHISKST